MQTHLFFGLPPGGGGLGRCQKHISFRLFVMLPPYKPMDLIQPNMLDDLPKQVGRAKSHLYCPGDPAGGENDLGGDSPWHAIDCTIMLHVIYLQLKMAIS